MTSKKHKNVCLLEIAINTMQTFEQDKLKDALAAFLTALVDDTIPEQHGAELYRTINEVVMGKLLPNADRTGSICALVGLLSRLPEAVTASGGRAQLEFKELAAHCVSVLAEGLKGSAQVKL